MVAEAKPTIVTEEDFWTAKFYLRRLMNWLHYGQEATKKFTETGIRAHQAHAERCLKEAKCALDDLNDRTTLEALAQVVLTMSEKKSGY